MKDYFFQNLKEAVSKSNNTSDVISFAKVLHDTIPRREWMPIREKVAEECSIRITYLLVFLNNPAVLYPSSRERFSPIIKKHLLAYLLQQRRNFEDNLQNVEALITKINNLDK